MSETTTPDPKLRKIFIAAFSLALLLQAWVAYVKLVQHPAPKWTDLAIVPLLIVFGFWVLLYPMAGMTGNVRRLFLAIFFGVSALRLILFFV